MAPNPGGGGIFDWTAANPSAGTNEMEWENIFTADQGSQSNQTADPTFDDATWQQYMQKLFMSGVGSEPGNMAVNIN